VILTTTKQTSNGYSKQTKKKEDKTI